MYALVRSAQVPSSLRASVTVIDMCWSTCPSWPSHNPIGWICLADGLLWTFIGMINYYCIYGLAQPGSGPFPVAIYTRGNWLWVLTVGLLAIF